MGNVAARVFAGYVGALKNRLQGKGYTPQELEEAGVVIRKDETGSYYDRFRGRLMIPIRDGQGRTIGFGRGFCGKTPPIRPEIHELAANAAL